VSMTSGSFALSIFIRIAGHWPPAIIVLVLTSFAFRAPLRQLPFFHRPCAPFQCDDAAVDRRTGRVGTF
jgi:hypothetical protein